MADWSGRAGQNESSFETILLPNCEIGSPSCPALVEIEAILSGISHLVRSDRYPV